MARKSNPAIQLVKTIFLLVFLFQLVRAFIPPDLKGVTFETAERVDLEKLLYDMDEFIDKPVRVEDVRVTAPAYFYLGSLYYLESLQTGSRLLVLSKEYPPKAGTRLSLLGTIQPVLSVDRINLAFFKPAKWEEAKEGLEAHLDF